MHCWCDLFCRSCSGRDWLGPHPLSDITWLSADRLNPAAVGQYVNNCCPDRPANVAYQEFDVPLDFPLALRRFLPNVPYTSQLVRCMVLVALRDIENGEELYSNYFTVIT
uniref:SET domain-containing protein n=1 Tax=Eptatretus burgeri TaxID=7764 RepID=A0A8C4QA89_EPTBU